MKGTITDIYVGNTGTGEKPKQCETDELSQLQEYERCVLCHKQTDVQKSRPVAERSCYVEGAGQLCQDCYKTVV